MNQPGLTAADMSRRKQKRDRTQREKEKEKEEKHKLEDQLKAEKEEKQKQRDIQMRGEDFWTVNSSFITRHHKRPRFEKYVPTERDSPIPLKWLDVMRFTSTSLPEAGMRSIDDYWLEDRDESLDMEWTGHTRFLILKPQARVNGREDKI